MSDQGQQSCMVELSALTLKVSMVLGININHRAILEGPGSPGPMISSLMPKEFVSLVDVTVPSLYRKGIMILTRRRTH